MSDFISNLTKAYKQTQNVKEKNLRRDFTYKVNLGIPLSPKKNLGCIALKTYFKIHFN